MSPNSPPLLELPEGPEPRCPALDGARKSGLCQAGTHRPRRHSPATHRSPCRAPGALSGRSRSSAGGPSRLQGDRGAERQEALCPSARTLHLWMPLPTPLPLLGRWRDRCPPARSLSSGVLLGLTWAPGNAPHLPPSEADVGKEGEFAVRQTWDQIQAQPLTS